MIYYELTTEVHRGGLPTWAAGVYRRSRHSEYDMMSIHSNRIWKTDANGDVTLLKPADSKSSDDLDAFVFAKIKAKPMWTIHTN